MKEDFRMQNPRVSGYRDLMVWQQSREIVKKVYFITQHFPKIEQFSLVSQMRRCSVSVPSNIAEGFARDSLKDYLRHLSIAMGSLAELQTQMILCVDVGLIAQPDVVDIESLIEKTLRMIKNLQQKLKLKLG